MSHPIILFDGVCNLCNASVNFIIDRDPQAIFRLAALQSDAGQRLLRQHDLLTTHHDSIVLLENDRIYTESAAALCIARRLTWPWSWFYAFIIVPRWLRDPLYRWIARNRYRWFGQRTSCRMPTPELKTRFLADHS